ncbi:hypothetical protein HPB47_018644 [Ixodes persulcatus]|uniref:Uncharacterized protein n=1 Tax=Ixodes persulcatus TaxID=34615 RepID=A0AC60QK55_IXOPE|nr:hypothetical protein HPB47_018644 [Ixodes persulcatus]
MATALTQDSPPPKAHAFDVVVPVGTSADDLIDGVSAIVGLPEIFSAQHLGGTNFQVVVNTRAAALKLREAWQRLHRQPVSPHRADGQEGHVRAQSTTDYCDRCGVFGHPTEDCTANCRRCGGTHATVDCTAKRSYSSMVAGNCATDFRALDRGNSTSPIAPEAPAVPPVSTVDPPSPPDATAAAPPPPPPSAPPSAPPEPSPTGSGSTSGEGTDSVRAAAVVVGDTAYAAWSPASGDGEVNSDSDHLIIGVNLAPGNPPATPTDSMDTTPTDTPDTDSSRPPHEDSERPLTSSGSRSTDNFEARFSVTAFFSYAPRRATGVGVVVCNRSLLRNATYLFDTEGRTVRFDFFFGERKFRLVTVYAPTVSTFQHDYFRSLDVHLLDAGQCFLVGDFNCVLDSNADVRGPGQGRSTWSARELRRLVRHVDLVDGWSFTAWIHPPVDVEQRGFGKSHRPATCTAVDFPSCLEEISDHRPLLIKFLFDSAVVRSSRPWRLDSRILHDETTLRTLGNLVVTRVMIVP